MLDRRGHGAGRDELARLGRALGLPAPWLPTRAESGALLRERLPMAPFLTAGVIVALA